MGKKSIKNQIIGLTMAHKDFWFNRMIRLSESSIAWDGLPDLIPSSYMERAITRTGSCIFYYDDVFKKYVVGQNISTGPLGIYRTPMRRAAELGNGESVQLDDVPSVIIYNSSDRVSDIPMFDVMSSLLAEIDMAIRVNINTQKTTPIFRTSQQQKLSIENAYNEAIQNMPYMLVSNEGFDMDSFREAITFDNRKSFTSDYMIAVQRELWNRVLTVIGINNTNVEKKERVNVWETNSNLDEIMIMRHSRLQQRKEGADRIKAKFGLELRPYYVSDIVNGIGGDGNGMVYGRGQGYLREGVSKPGGDNTAVSDYNT